jgi:ribosomal-protein-alanine N-acetyltransferase
VNVRLIDLPLPVLESLAAGDAAAAGEALGLEIPADFTPREGFWASFATKLRAAPSSAGWHVYAVARDDVIVGDAGFKGPPDADGAVEIGCAILPEHRRNGYALAAARLLLERAAGAPAARLVRAEVVESNAASVAVLAKAGFQLDGERIDPDEGRLFLYSHVARWAP